MTLLDDDLQHKRSRTQLLCDQCRKRKVKCDRKMPCLSCVRHKKGHLCDYSGDVAVQMPNTEFSNNVSIFRMVSTGDSAGPKQAKQTRTSVETTPRNGDNIHKWKDAQLTLRLTPLDVSNGRSFLTSESTGSRNSVVFSELEMLKLKVQQLEASLQKSSSTLQSSLNGSSSYLPEIGVTQGGGLRHSLPGISSNSPSDPFYTGINPYDVLKPDEEIDLYDGYNPIHTGYNRQMNYGPYSWLTIMKKDEALIRLARFIKYNSAKMEKATLPVVPKDATTSKRIIVTHEEDHDEEFRQKALTRDGDVDVAPLTQHAGSINEMKIKMNQNSMALGLTFFEGELDQKLHLIEKIRLVLPTKMSVWVLVNRFFITMYPFVPFVDEIWFRNEMKRLLGPEVYTEDKFETIFVEKRLDLAILGLLLIVLRLSYLSCFSNNKAENDRVLASDIHLSLAETKYILTHPIDMDVINLAEVCLDQFDLFRRTNFVVLQCAVFMRVYHMFAPEEGDGSDGGDAQVYNSMCLQMAMCMGLNREPDKLEGYECDEKQKNLGRKIWHYLKLMDMSQSFQYGFPLLIDDNYNDVRVPYYRPGNSNLIDANLEKVVCDGLNASNDLLQDLRHLLKVSLGMRQKIKMNHLTKLVSELEIKLKDHLGTLSDFISGSIVPGDYPFKKVMACKMYMNAKSFSLSLFFHFFLNYERLNRTDLAFFYLRKVWAISCGEFMPKFLQLITDNRINFDPNSTTPDFILSPSLQFLIHKSNQMYFSLLIRMYYTIHNMKKDVELHSRNLLLLFEYKLRYARLCKLAKMLEKFCKYMTSCLSRLSSRYYYAWRILKAHKYILDSLDDEKFHQYVASGDYNFITLTSDQLNELLSVADASLWQIKSFLARDAMSGENVGITPSAENEPLEESRDDSRPLKRAKMEQMNGKNYSPSSTLSFDFETFSVENNGEIDEMWQQLTNINYRMEAESQHDIQGTQGGGFHDGWIPLYLHNSPYQPFSPATGGFDMDNMFDPFSTHSPRQ